MPFLTMWSDEYHSVRISALPMVEILRGNYTGDLNPPLYFAALHIWRNVWGSEELTLRFFSLIFSIAALPVTYLLARAILKSDRLSLTALMIAAAHPLPIFYANEIRSYALFAFFGILTFLSCIKIQENTKFQLGWLMTLIISLTIVIYTHHFGVIVFISLAVYIVGTRILIGHWLRGQILVAGGLAAASLFYLPGFLRLLSQLTQYPAVFERSPVGLTFQIFSLSLVHPALQPIFIGVTLAAFGLGCLQLLLALRQQPNNLIILAGVFSAALVVILASWRGINTNRRYLLMIVPLTFIAAAAALSKWRVKYGAFLQAIGWLTIFITIFSGLDLVINTGLEDQAVTWKADWKQISQVIRERKEPQEKLVLMGWDATPIQYYLQEPALSSYALNQQYPEAKNATYMLVVTPNSEESELISSAEVIYSDEKEGVSLRRIRIP